MEGLACASVGLRLIISVSRASLQRLLSEPVSTQILIGFVGQKTAFLEDKFVVIVIVGEQSENYISRMKACVSNVVVLILHVCLLQWHN